VASKRKKLNELNIEHEEVLDLIGKASEQLLSWMWRSQQKHLQKRGYDSEGFTGELQQRKFRKTTMKLLIFSH
jgi:hypothetical protein